ncbi:MAG TPA: Rrf2 family transcriptional regulator [Fibrobacteria bacterium]|nr:Rrf2 family transcriptional regulator [Fibrobacteria bacterium]
MKVSSKTLYTFQFLSALAIKGRKTPVQLREIAAEYDIPFKFLEQIAILMKGVGLVRGTRGKTGGYQLAVPPENIDLARVIRATEGEVLPCADIDGGNAIVGELLSEIFARQRAAVERGLSSVTLAEIAEKARRKMEPAPMFYV